jgi:hypothetical protein|tara:strand:- start:34001 stop:34240 length:240 start_codon:yes stop_codon:yes gene_type:complete
VEKPRTIIIQTDLENYSDCLECLEEELIKGLSPADFQLVPTITPSAGLDEFVRIQRVHEALRTLRALCEWADGYEGTEQ